MDIIEALNNRYSTKSFDSRKKLTTEQTQQIKDLLRLSPSSTNIQPWHFIIADTDEGKTRIAKGTQGFFHFNEAKVLGAAQVVVFCSRISADEDYMKHLLEVEDGHGRYPTEEIKQMVYGVRNLFYDIHRYDLKDYQHWLEKQVYINIGNFLLGVAALGLDALPMEGIDLKAIDEEFDLREKGFTTVAVVAVGYRAEDDFNAPEKTPKSRLEEDEVFTLI